MALVSRCAHAAVLEAYDGRLPRPELRHLVRDVRRLRWAAEVLGVRVSGDAAAMAAAGEGSLMSLKWLAENHYSRREPWSVGVCKDAARGGHLDVLRYVRHVVGSPWDGSVCANAASAGHLEVLQWLREEGCPWDKMTTAWAELNGHRAVAEWAVANGCDRSEELLLRLRMARVMAER